MIRALWFCMTGPYDWNPMPHRVAIRCPDCASEAVFEFAELVRIEHAKDVPFFKESAVFEYVFFPNTGSGRWHGAFFFHGLRAKGMDEIRELPEGYRAEQWEHGPYLYRSHGYDLGTVLCKSCHQRKRHVLAWPDEAFFQVEYKGRVLWAFDRDSAVVLRDFIGSKDRRKKGPWAAFLRHVPTHFLRAGARDAVLKKLNVLLSP